MTVDDTGSDLPFAVDPTQTFAYTPGTVIVRGSEASERLQSLTSAELVGERGAWLRFVAVADPLPLIDLLRSEGYDAQPDHVFFAHGCQCCGPHPSWVQDVAAWGLLPQPLRGNPLRGNPLRGNPLRGNPLRGNPLRGNASTSTAVPAPGRALPVRELIGPGTPPTVYVIDTGIARSTGPNFAASGLPDFAPTLIEQATHITGELDVPDLAGDGYLDPVAGHGTFIAGLIEQLAPGCSQRVVNAIGPFGEVSEWKLAQEIDAAVAAHHAAIAAKDPHPTIINLSLGGQTMVLPNVLRNAVALASLAGVVVVASAGNDGVCTPQYPAAFPNVIAVGALGPDGPAEFTNYGDWVDACAPGTDLVSAFFDGWNGKFPSVNSSDVDKFSGWAVWSGTSFAAPVVVAALCREIVMGNCTGPEAVARVIRAPHLMRIPGLGTVVNL